MCVVIHHVPLQLLLPRADNYTESASCILEYCSFQRKEQVGEEKVKIPKNLDYFNTVFMCGSFTEMLTKSLPTFAGLSFERVGVFSVTRISLSKPFTQRQDSLLIPTSLQCTLFSLSLPGIVLSMHLWKNYLWKSHTCVWPPLFSFSSAQKAWPKPS